MAGHAAHERAAARRDLAARPQPRVVRPALLVSVVAVVARHAVRHGAGRRRSASRCRRRSPPSPTAPGARPMRWRRRSTARWRSPWWASASSSPSAPTSPTSAARARSRSAASPPRRSPLRRRGGAAGAARLRRADARRGRSPAALWGGDRRRAQGQGGTNEVISTLLLSFIAVWMLYGCGAVRGACCASR